MARTKATTVANNNAVEEAPKVLKNFKTNSDIEAFYRFVYEGDLRLEANKLMRLRSGIVEKAKSKRKSRKKKAKILQ